jgi:hypothetical protein
MSSEEVLIHVRFSPDGTVADIGECPQAASAQSWFNQLASRCGEAYQPLSGGRGLFRLARSEVDALKTSLASA